MKITIIAALTLMAVYFLVLYGAVGFIQDKRFFSSAPKENLAAIPDKKERFRGAHIIGWLIEGIAVLMFIGAAVLAAWDGVRSGFDGRPWNWRNFINFFTSPSFFSSSSRATPCISNVTSPGCGSST